MEVHSKKSDSSEILRILGNWGYAKPHLTGRGAFSEVYRVMDSASGHFCACKISAQVEMLQREAGFLQQIKHSLFPEFYDFRQEKGTAFLFMEYIPGRDLSELLAKRGRLSERQAIRVAGELAEGLCCLHEQNPPILYRDLKPENIRIREDGRVKLLDMGSAALMEAAGNSITGTRGYAAPEQWKYGEKAGFYSDIYALGQVMNHMLSGEKLYWGVQQLLVDCINENAGERVPDMKCFLRRLAPYRTEKRCRILWQELQVRIRCSHPDGYVYQQNIMKY